MTNIPAYWMGFIKRLLVLHIWYVLIEYVYFDPRYINTKCDAFAALPKHTHIEQYQ